MSAARAVWDWLTQNGVGQNILGSVLWTTPAALWARRKWLRHRATQTAMHALLDELHEHHIRVPRAAADAAQELLDEAGGCR